MEGAERPASREECSETFSILAFLSAGGAGVSPFCKRCDMRQFKSYLLQSDAPTITSQTLKIDVTFAGGGAKLAGPADEAMTLSTWPFYRYFTY